MIYNGVAGPGRPLRPRNGPFTIGCIGRIAPEKGQREFVEVARTVHRKNAGSAVRDLRRDHVRV